MSFARRIAIHGHSNLNSFKKKAFKEDIKSVLKNNSPRPMTTDGPKKASSQLYMKIINAIEPFVPTKMRPMWEHEAGPKTIFFWAPLMKAGLVLASIKDLKRSPDTISPRQSASLAFTGVLWSRWSLIIIPKNYLMFGVNFFVFLTQAIQTARSLMHEQISKRGA